MRYLATSITGIVLLFAAPLCAGGLVPAKPSCEYASDPLGIDTLRPRLGWSFGPSTLRGQRQTAYEVLVASSPEALQDGKADLWDSGKVVSDENVSVEYAGKSLASGTSCWWKVRLWDESDSAGAYSAPGRFELGLLEPQDWKDAQWIAWRAEDRWKKEYEARKAKEEERFPFEPRDPALALDPANGWNYPARYQNQPKPLAKSLTDTDWNIFSLERFHDVPYDPAPLLRREFEIRQPVRRARVYLATTGYYELHLNGKRVGDQVRDPGWTDAARRVLYVTHDVTADLSPGANAVGVMLGRGFGGSLVIDRPGFYKTSQQPKMKLRLSVEYADGTRTDMVSDTDWKVAGGPVIFDDPYRGEIVDARQQAPGWDAAGFDCRTWEAVHEAPAPAGAVVAQRLPPIRAVEEIHPVTVATPSPGVYVFDFGKNISGWVRLKASGPAGTEVLVRYSELDPPGNRLPQPRSFYYSYQQHGFILQGQGVETFEPRFSYAGFRYAVASSAPGVLGPDSLTAVHVHTDLPSAGQFECSNPLVNDIHRAVRLTQLNNTQSVPTDCPQREKKGWLDPGLYCTEMVILNFSAAAFYEKWVDDIFDSAVNNASGLPYIFAPSPRTGRSYYEPVWQASAVVVPWNLYLYYGDRRILSTYYEAMQRFVDLWAGPGGRVAENVPYLLKGKWGDWVPPKEGQPGPTGGYSKEGVNLYATAYFYHCVDTLAKIAAALGNAADAAGYRDLAANVRQAFDREFYDPQAKCYRGETRTITEYRQSADAVPLYVGLVPEDKRPAILRNLVGDLAARHDRLNTGTLGTKALMEVLPADGQGEAAYRVAAQTEEPSWGAMIRRGMTTIGEQWGSGGSQDHPPFASVGAYYYRWLGGIQPDERHPGFRRFFLRPTFVKDLDFVRTSYSSPSGMIGSRWARNNGVLTWEVTVPPNTTAEVTIPAAAEAITENNQPLASVAGVKRLPSGNGNAVLAVPSGAYQFQWTCHEKSN